MNDSNHPEGKVEKAFIGRGCDQLWNAFIFMLFRFRLSLRLRIVVNSIVLPFPAFLQFLFFYDPEYIISFFLCLTFLLSVFFLSRIRLFFSTPLVIASMMYSIYIVLYSKSPGATAIIAVYNTRIEAIYGFMKSPMMITGILVFAVLMFLYTRLILIVDGSDREMEPLKWKSRLVLVGVMLATVFTYLPIRGHLQMAYPFSVVYDSSSYLKIVSRMKKVAERKYKFSGSLEPYFNKESGNYILIVGESERRGHWSLYGYQRKTNVYLQEIIDEHPRNFILFKEYTAIGQTTYPNLMSIFSVIPSRHFHHIPDYPSFTRILSNVSFKVYFVSTYNNIFNTFIGADQNIFVKSGDDLSLLPEIKKILEDRTAQKKFIIVHLRGSHMAFCDYRFTYEDYIFPSADKIVDKYDNSITHTSEFLKEMAKTVISAASPVCAWYMPDHGENLNDFGDGDYGHGESDFTRYEIELPSVMFFNDSFTGTNPELKMIEKNNSHKISHSNVAHTFFGLTGIYPSEYLEEFDLSSPYYKYEEPYLVNSDLFPFKYSRVKIKGLSDSRK